MSDNLARAPFAPSWARPVTDPVEAPRPHVEPAPLVRRNARPRLFYAAVAVGGIAAIFIAKLLLSVALTQGAYAVNDLQNDGKSLAQNVQAVSEDLDQVKSPQSLASHAAALGMVVNDAPVYLRLSDGTVIGTPTRATGTPISGSQVPNSLLAAPAAASSDAAASDASDATAGDDGVLKDGDAAGTAPTAGGDAAAATAGATTTDSSALPTPQTH